MSIPTNADGDFEVVDSNGTVQGTGRVDNGDVAFVYGTGTPASLLSVERFEDIVATNPVFQHLTLRAAGA